MPDSMQVHFLNGVQFSFFWTGFLTIKINMENQRQEQTKTKKQKNKNDRVN